MQNEKKSAEEAVVSLGQTVRRVLKITTPVTLEKVVAGVTRMGGTFENVALVNGRYEHQMSVRSTGPRTFVVYERHEIDTTDYRKATAILHAVYNVLVIGFGNTKLWRDDSRYVMSNARPNFVREQWEGAQFVAEVMMPKNEIENRPLEYLAEYFSVPLKVMQNRQDLSKMFQTNT